MGLVEKLQEQLKKSVQFFGRNPKQEIEKHCSKMDKSVLIRPQIDKLLLWFSSIVFKPLWTVAGLKPKSSQASP